MLTCLILFMCLFQGQIVFADELMSVSNAEPPAAEDEGQSFQPGEMILLPDASVTLIEEELPSGELKAGNGTIITREGKIRGTDGRAMIFRQAQLEMGAKVRLPDGKEDVISEKLPDGFFKTKSGALLTQDGRVWFKIDHVETFEEAEKFIAQEGADRQKEEGVTKLDGDMMAEILAFNEETKTEKEASGTGKRAKQPKTAFAAKKGDKLKIPPGAAARKDYSFLKGCWRSNAVTYYRGYTPYKAPAELCFNGGNSGSFMTYFKKNDGGFCRANMTARFSSGALLIQAALGPCQTKGHFTMPRMFQCEGVGENTECYILAKDNENKSRRFKSRSRFYKK